MENKTDYRWLDELSRGREEAYRLLFERYYALLGVFAYRYLNDRQLCEDVIHDVFLELYQGKERFLNIIALKSYLYRAVRNRCVDLLRHQRIRTRYEEQMCGEEQEAFYEEGVLEAEAYALLKKAITELPEQTRAVYDLVLQGLNNREIAGKLSLTEDAVKAHKKRGKKILREKLEYLLSVSLLLRLFLS